MIKARVTVTLKNGVLDPQGKAIEGALGTLGFSGVGQVRHAFDLRFGASHDCGRAALDGFGDKILTVESRAAKRAEHIARRDLAVVERKAGHF